MKIQITFEIELTNRLGDSYPLEAYSKEALTLRARDDLFEYANRIALLKAFPHLIEGGFPDGVVSLITYPVKSKIVTPKEVN